MPHRVNSSANQSGVSLHASWPTDTRGTVSNSQEPGIGRLACFGDLIVIDNLGRNIQFCSLANNALSTLRVSDFTLFPDLDVESQFDLDIHAFLKIEETSTLLAINHYGLLRFFPFDQLTPCGDRQDIVSSAYLKWPGDVECLRVASHWLIGTSPRGYQVADRAQPGIIVSDVSGKNLSRAPEWQRHALPKNGLAMELPYQSFLEDWGYTTALACHANTGKLAVAAANRVGIFDLHASPAFSYPALELEADFIVDWLQFTTGGATLLCAGYDNRHSGADESAWDDIGGGGWRKVSCATGKAVAAGHFDVDLAWGNGGVPIVVSHDEASIYAVDKCAGLHNFHLDSSAHTVVVEAQTAVNIGLAHMARCGSVLLCGFNRDGYRIHSYSDCP